MEFLNNIADSIKGYFDKKSEDREMFEKLQKETEMQRRQMFMDEYKKNSLIVAKQAAKNDALNKSGLAKLRATNRMIQLDKQGQEPGTVFSKLADYTRKNMARREENLKRTETMRQQAKLQVDSDRQKKLVHRDQVVQNRPIVFGKPTWKM